MSKKTEIHIHLNSLIEKVEIKGNVSEDTVNMTNQVSSILTKSLLSVLAHGQDMSETQTKQALNEKDCSATRADRIDHYFRSLRYGKSYLLHSWLAPLEKVPGTSEELKKSML